MKINYSWVEEKLGNVEELIRIGDPISFRFGDRDYFIEGHHFDTGGKQF